MKKSTCILNVFAVFFVFFLPLVVSAQNNFGDRLNRDFVVGPVAFTLPDGSTQISWVSATPLPASTVQCSDENGQTFEYKEADDGMRNHRVVLEGLTLGKKYTARIQTPPHQTGKGIEKTLTFVAGARPKAPPTVATKIKLTVAEPTKFGRTKGYVTSGVPFAPGTLAGPNDVVLQNEKGEPVEAQFDVMATWDDGSVQWLLCDFATETKPGVPAVYYLMTAPNAQPAKETDKRQVEEKRLEEIMKRLASDIILGDGTKLSWQPGPIEYETKGNVRTSVRGVGDYVKPDGTPFFRWRVHLSFFGNNLLRIRWALCNNNETADHSLIRSASFSVDLPKTEGTIRLSDGKSGAKSLSILQDRVDHAVVNLDGQEETVKQANGFVQIDKHGFWMRDFWQTWPKGLAYQDDRLRFDILPQLPANNYPPDGWTTEIEKFMHWYWFKDGCYQFKRGLEVQAEAWLVLDEQIAGNPEACAAWLAQPLFAVAEPAIYCTSGAFPPINPRREGVFDIYEKAFETSFANLEKGRQERAEYGWMNFGDWFGERRWNWGNNEYDISYVCAMHFARTGNLDFLNRADEMTRHYTTVDVNFSPREPRTKELVYGHSTGHIGNVDTTGGHSFQPGNFYLACLTGDKRFLDVAEMVCMNQAKYQTPTFDFPIERSAGWALTNAMAAYHFTRNPFYLQAADIYVEKILSKQNPETGGFDMPQSGSECNCPVGTTSLGGKSFAVGVLLHGLARYYEQTGKPEVKQCIVRCADWLLDHAWNDAAKVFRYKTGCFNADGGCDGGSYVPLVTEGIAYAGELSGNPRYVDFLVRTFGRELGETTNVSLFAPDRGFFLHIPYPQASAKDFSQWFRHIPHALYFLEKHGHQSLPVGPEGQSSLESDLLKWQTKATAMQKVVVSSGKRVSTDDYPNVKSLTTGKPATASDVLGEHHAKYANDGVRNVPRSFWACDVAGKSEPPWWMVDLEQSTDVERVVVVCYYADVRYYGFFVEGSLDGKNWTTLADFRDNKKSSTIDGYDCRFAKQSVRYLRVTQTHNSANTGRHLIEVMAFGPETP